MYRLQVGPLTKRSDHFDGLVDMAVASWITCTRYPFLPQYSTAHNLVKKCSVFLIQKNQLASPHIRKMPPYFSATQVRRGNLSFTWELAVHFALTQCWLLSVWIIQVHVHKLLHNVLLAPARYRTKSAARHAVSVAQSILLSMAIRFPPLLNGPASVLH